MRLVVFETVEILVAFAASIAFVWLLFLHAQCPRVWRERSRIDDGKSPVRVFVKCLVVMAVLQNRIS